MNLDPTVSFTMPNGNLRTNTNFSEFMKSFSILYFLQGLPYGLQTRFLPLYFRMRGMSLTNVGLYKLLLVPWILKFLWAPIVDNYGSKRTWLAWTLILLMALCVIAAIIPPEDVALLAVILFLFNLITSMQDIALDALVIDVLSPSQLAMGNIAQVVGYKAGTLFSGGIFVWLTGKISWGTIFYSLAALYGIGFCVSAFYLPPTSRFSDMNIALLRRRRSNTPQPGTEDTNSVPHIPTAVGRDTRPCFIYNIFNISGTLWMLVFLLMYKIGEQGVMNMFPLYLLDHGTDPQSVGFWTGMAAQSLSLIGSTFAGIFQTQSMVRSLKFQLFVRAISVGFIWLSILAWAETTSLSYITSIASLMVLFLLSGGITTCTFTLVMQLSQTAPLHCRASHYTILATAEVMGKLLFSAAVGAVAQYTSYSFVFGLFTFASVIILPLIFLTPDAVDIIT